MGKQGVDLIEILQAQSRSDPEIDLGDPRDPPVHGVIGFGIRQQPRGAEREPPNWSMRIKGQTEQMRQRGDHLFRLQVGRIASIRIVVAKLPCDQDSGSIDVAL